MKKVKRLYSGFKPERYDVFLEVFREESFFRGKVIVRGKKTGRPSHRITLHQKDLKIVKASIIRHDKSGDLPIKVHRINTQKTLDELRLHSKDQLYPGSYTIEVHFAGKLTEPMHGIYPCNFSLKGHKKQLIATQFESHHAREAFPCIDEPEAKASYKLTIKVPSNETVISNTPVEFEKKSGSTKTIAFEPTPKMSSYLLAFAYGELGYKESQTKNKVKVRVYSTKDKVELTDFALDVAVRCLEFFEDYYGAPYPLPKLDLIGLPDFSAGAMENWGLITFRESVLYVDPKSTSIETKQAVAMVVCHEIAHMWFGNLVTMKWWNDLWLNESFANMMEYLAVDHLFPEWEIWDEFVQREIGSALSRDSLPNVQPVQVEVNHPDELGALFDPSIVYAKGGSLLNMVRHLVGDDNFRAGLNTYFEEYKYKNTVADDLWNHLGKASGLDIKAMMKSWLQKPGFPVLEVKHRPGSKKFSVSQQRLIVSEKPVSPETTWVVPIAPSVKTDEKILDKRQADFSLKNKSEYPLTLNHNGRSYFVAQYLDKDHLNEILASIKKGTLNPIDRLILVQSYLLLERAGRIGTLENIKLLPAYERERDETVWSMLSGIIGNVRTLIDKDEELQHKLNAYIRPIIKPLVDELGWQSSKSDTAQTQKLRALALSLAAVAEDQSVIKQGLKLFKNFQQPADLSPDIRSVVYFIAIRHGKPTDFKQLISLYNSLNNSDEKEEIASELTSTHKSPEIQQLLKMMKTDVRPQDALHWLAWLMRNRYSRDDTWAWLQKNWEWVEKKFGSDKSYDYFPRYVAMAFSYPDQLKQYRAFFEPKSNIALERPIKLGVEEIEARIAWRQRNEANVKDWLAKLAQ